MTPDKTPTDAEIDVMVAAYLGDCGPQATRVYSFARAVLARWGEPAHSGEPVAWLDPWTSTKVTTDYDAYGKHGIPLYTAPQPVERELLTDEQIKDIQDDGVFLGTCRQIVRAIEAAHGIRKEGGQHAAN